MDELQKILSVLGFSEGQPCTQDVEHPDLPAEKSQTLPNQAVNNYTIEICKSASGPYLEICGTGCPPFRFKKNKARALALFLPELEEWYKTGIIKPNSHGSIKSYASYFKGHEIFVIEGASKRPFGFGKRKAEMVLSFKSEITSFAHS